MKNTLRFRFWLEIIMALGTAILLAVAFVCNDWIEIAFGLNPDHGSGWMEWFMATVLLVATITLSVLARREWRGAQNEEYQYE
jgi:hypothetical protein